MSKDNFMSFLGIKCLHISKDLVICTIKLSSKLFQIYGFLHGGVSISLAETCAGIISNIGLSDKNISVGFNVHANHLRPVKKGNLFAYATIINRSSKYILVNVNIKDDSKKLICNVNVTNVIIDKYDR